jgi:hypothetical protein
VLGVLDDRRMRGQPHQRRIPIDKPPHADRSGVGVRSARLRKPGSLDDPGAGQLTRHGTKAHRINTDGDFDGFANVIRRRGTRIN